MQVITVIVPVYNVEQWLERCIDSIVAQTYADWELLLVDDGSTDRSGAICDRYAASVPRIKAFHKPNGGLSSARNYGIDKSNGEYILFIDSDDYFCDNNALSELIKETAKHGYDILRFEYKGVNDKGEVIVEKPLNRKLPHSGHQISNFEMVKYAIAGEWFAWLFFIKKTILGDLRFNEQRRFQEDIEFYARLFSNKELSCGYIPNRFYAYRNRSNSITTTANVRNLEGSFSLCEVFAEEAETITENKLRKLYWYNSVMMYYWTLNTVSEAPYYANRKQIISGLQLKQLHQRTVKRLGRCKFLGIYYLVILPSPNIGAMLLHIKNKVAVSAYKLIRR